MNTPLAQGVLIAFEGIDGAGKSTQADLLRERLEAAGVPVVQSREPTDPDLVRRLRARQGPPPAPAEELQAFMDDRRRHVAALIRPALEEGRVVIVDRYYFSSAAYQGALGLDPDQILRDNEAFAPEPDLLVILELDPDEAIGRIRDRGAGTNPFEREANLRRCAAIFASIRRPYLVRIDAGLQPLEIHRRVLAAVRRLPALQGVGLTGGEAG